MGDPRFTWGNGLSNYRKVSGMIPNRKSATGSVLVGQPTFLDGELLILDFEEQAAYADMGCNVEFITMLSFLEMETLSLLTQMITGESLTYRERWGLYDIFGENEEPSIND